LSRPVLKTPSFRPEPLVSLGIPVYNGESFLRPGLDALLAQTYEHLELIISDNASTDGTPDICRAYAARDRRLKYYRNPTNVGVVENYRRAFALSTGAYFMWAAVDDLKPPTAVEECLAALRHDERAVLAHGIVRVQIPGGRTPVEYPNDVDMPEGPAAARVRAFIEGMFHNAILYGLYPRQALQRVVLGHCLGQDYLLTLQMCLVGSFAYVRAPIITYSERKTVASSSPMYTAIPLTLGNLLQAGKVHRRKCWIVLFMGTYFLATIDGVGWSDRWRAVATHVVTFYRVYHARLAREVVFQSFEPLAWLAGVAWRLGRRWGVVLRLKRKIQALLTS
jgi:glycosyltransferase involved in cell wall biosynthesis